MVWGFGSGALGLRAFGFGVQGFWGFGASGPEGFDEMKPTTRLRV